MKARSKHKPEAISVLFGRLKDARFNIAELEAAFLTTVEPLIADRCDEASGIRTESWEWAVRDRALKPVAQRRGGGSRGKSGGAGRSRANGVPPGNEHLLKQASSAVTQALKIVEGLKVGISGARFVRWTHASKEAQIAGYAARPGQNWQLYVPLPSSPVTLFQWLAADEADAQARALADGSGYLVRADLAHRAVAAGPLASVAGSVQLVIDLTEPPGLDHVVPGILATTRSKKPGKGGPVLAHTMLVAAEEDEPPSPFVAGRFNGAGADPAAPGSTKDGRMIDEAHGHPRQAHLLIDHETGNTLSSVHADLLFCPAGLSKLLVLYEVFAALRRGDISLGTEIEIPAMRHRRRFIFQDGERITIEKAIRGLVQRQSNNVALALANRLHGSAANSVAQLTWRAGLLGMTSTNISNITGRNHPEHVSTLPDMGRLCRATIRGFPEYFSYFGETNFVHNGRIFDSRNLLLGTYEGVDGLICARNRVAGHHIAVTAMRAGRRLIALAAGAASQPEAAGRAAALLEQGDASSMQRTSATTNSKRGSAAALAATPVGRENGQLGSGDAT